MADHKVVLARHVHPGRTYLLTRRCSERRFFLGPSPELKAIFAYVLARAVSMTRVKVYFRLETPPGIDPVECQMEVRPQMRMLERKGDEEVRVRGGKFLGEKRVLRQNPYDSPSSWEKRRGRNPTVASRDKWARIEAAQRNRGWLSGYEAA